MASLCCNAIGGLIAAFDAGTLECGNIGFDYSSFCAFNDFNCQQAVEAILLRAIQTCATNGPLDCNVRELLVCAQTLACADSGCVDCTKKGR